MQRYMNDQKDRALPHRFRNGLAGFVQGWKRERSLRTQLVLSVVAVLVLLAARVPFPWLLAFLALIAVALAAELVNGAIEALLDRLHPGHDADIGAAKDMSSAAVLIVNVAAGTAFVIALIVTFG
jgi:diacylglycerol kinase